MVNFSKYKRFFVYSLIGALVLSAGIAVVAVLIGEFNETMQRVLLTLVTVMAHSLVSLAFIWDDSRKNTFERMGLFSNVLFVLLIFSFFTSVLGIWEVLEIELTGDLYQLLFLIAFSSLHINLLLNARVKEKYFHWLAYANTVFVVIVAALLLPVIFLADPVEVLGEFYFRVLAAIAIIDGTLSALMAILYRLYVHKHPEVREKDKHGKSKGMSIWIWLLLVYLFFQFIIPIFFFFGSLLWFRGF